VTLRAGRRLSRTDHPFRTMNPPPSGR